MKRIGVGVIGSETVDPGRSVVAHAAAIRCSPEFELRAICTDDGRIADTASFAHDFPSYDDPLALIDHPDVDLVVVAVDTPGRHAAISAALDAGKMVFSEWPLASDLGQAEEVAGKARTAGVRTFIDLRARYAPAIHHARDLVRRGFVGEVLATTLVGSGMKNAKRKHASRGTPTLSEAMLHALDALTSVLGDFDTVSATTAMRESAQSVLEGERSPDDTVADHVAISGRLCSGALVSAFYRAGTSRAGNFRWEINGTDGDMVLTASNGDIQIADFNLEGGCGDDATVVRLDTPPSFTRSAGALAGEPAANVLREYAAIARDLRHGTQSVPGFEYALSRHRLLVALKRAAASGMRQKVSEAATSHRRPCDIDHVDGAWLGDPT